MRLVGRALERMPDYAGRLEREPRTCDAPAVGRLRAVDYGDNRATRGRITPLATAVIRHSLLL